MIWEAVSISGWRIAGIRTVAVHDREMDAPAAAIRVSRLAGQQGSTEPFAQLKILPDGRDGPPFLSLS
jgi:hypothetical protein